MERVKVVKQLAAKSCPIASVANNSWGLLDLNGFGIIVVNELILFLVQSAMRLYHEVVVRMKMNYSKPSDRVTGGFEKGGTTYSLLSFRKTSNLQIRDLAAECCLS